MNKNKILITGGCSFSDGYGASDSENLYRQTWSPYIKEKYDFKRYIYMGNPASGNELIAERVIYALQTLLDKGVRTTEGLVDYTIESVTSPGTDGYGMMDGMYDFDRPVASIGSSYVV